MKEKNRQTKRKRLDTLLEMPKEIISSEPKITMIGFNEMLIENYKGILEYEEFFVKLSTHIGIININGFNLKLEEMTSDDIMIKGKIEGIDFEKTVE